MKIHFNNDLNTTTKTLLKQAISSGLRVAGVSRRISYELNLSIVTQEDIMRLNNEYRNKSTPTDVLSFPANSRLMPPQKRKKPIMHLGDIAICQSVAAAQAHELGHSLDRELVFLAVHGLLHLLGYDHQTPQDEAEMIRLQKQALNWLGLGKEPDCEK